MTSRFPISALSIARTLAEVLETQGSADLADVVRAAEPRVEEDEYDNWNGGTTYYTLHLEATVSDFAQLEPRLEEIEKSFAGKLRNALRVTGNDVLTNVVITPTFDESGPGRSLSPQDDDIERIWGAEGLRLFLSHLATHKVAVSALKRELRHFGTAAFVAHEDIEPTAEWQAEIEAALLSMDAMVALLTPGFHASKWTDQEVGFALGRNVLVIPVRLPDDPYGFFGKFQALAGDLGEPAGLARRIVGLLSRNKTTRARMLAGLVTAIEGAPSFDKAREITECLEAMAGYTEAQLDRIEASITSNYQVEGSRGTARRLNALIARERQRARVS